MSVILINRSKRMRVYSMDTTELVGALGQRRVFHQVLKNKAGELRPARIHKTIPETLTLCAGERTGKFSNGKLLPDAILKVPSIAADIQSGVLRAARVEERKVVAAKPSTKSNKRRGR